jgi:hypothetical protein
MKRAIFVVQALALLGACRNDSTVTQTERSSSSGEEQHAAPAALDASAIEASTDAAIPSDDAPAPRDPYAVVDDEPPPDGAARSAHPRRGRARTLISANQCNDRNPDGMGCSTLGAFCTGGVTHCASGPPNGFRPCSGSQWQCRCMDTDEGAAWSCQVQMRAAGPLPPPELA